MHNQVVFITGGTRGLGLATARECLAQGAKVALNYRHDDTQAGLAKQALNAGDRVLLLKGDISDVSLHDGFLQTILSTFGQLDVLVNNAGIVGWKSFMEATPELYDQVMTVNVKGTYFLSQTIAHYWIEHQQMGNIINIASVAGHRAAPGLTPYCVSKAAVLSMTKCMAKELAPQGIRVNSVSPGVIATDINRQFWEDEQRWSEVIKGIPLGRCGKPENIAQAVVLLIQNDFAIGTDIVVDGGART